MFRATEVGDGIGGSVGLILISILIAAVSCSFLFDAGGMRTSARDRLRRGAGPTPVPYDGYNIVWTFALILAVLSVVSTAREIVAIL
ncbi:hypothetical protein [Streptomyces sp. NBC_01198]|uniref:hypothetical protein n=1 Tax=Streptomyces sp. NBC_01198 TaxID=2903769 RepID=UPI002E1080B1|nr:hypothetical protein OG702_00380 [Streptomyces sp. NBC_01198]